MIAGGQAHSSQAERRDLVGRGGVIEDVPRDRPTACDPCSASAVEVRGAMGRLVPLDQRSAQSLQPIMVEDHAQIPVRRG